MTGTRFRLYPQSPDADGTTDLETVYVSSPAGSLRPGPSDDRMYTVYPVDKPIHYGIHEDEHGDPLMVLPPWPGDVYPLAKPGPDGHFDHLQPGTREFEAAHLFGCTRFTLDVWERYFDHQIDWHFRDDYDRLELSILPEVDNAFMGWGFLETGGIESDGKYSAFFLNFDVIAHEVGHGIIYQEIGMPPEDGGNAEYLGFHESAGDVVSMIAALHFDSVVDRLLESTSGNLYTMNRLNRFAETSHHQQIRLAANDYVMSDFADGWDDEHDLGEPLTAAVYDILIDLFHEQLVNHGLISPDFEHLSDVLESTDQYGAILQDRFDRYYNREPEGFRECLLLARDFLGTYLADIWTFLDTETLSYRGVGKALCLVDQTISGGRFERIIANNFRLRELGVVAPGPRLSKPGNGSKKLVNRNCARRAFQTGTSRKTS